MLILQLCMLEIVNMKIIGYGFQGLFFFFEIFIQRLILQILYGVKKNIVIWGFGVLFFLDSRIFQGRRYSMVDMFGLLSMDINEKYLCVIKRLRIGKVVQLLKFCVGSIFFCNFILIFYNFLNVIEVFFYNVIVFCID